MIVHVDAGLSNVCDASTVTGLIEKAIAGEKSLLFPDTQHDFGIDPTDRSNDLWLAPPHMRETSKNTLT